MVPVIKDGVGARPPPPNDGRPRKVPSTLTLISTICVTVPVPNIIAEHYAGMNPTIAFVGAGPTTIYTLNALIDHTSVPFSLNIFEEQASVGLGTPYRPGWNDPAMLSNIASVEIPPLAESLVDWLGRQSSERLVRLGIEPCEIDDRAFYPRLALGEYFVDQLHALIDRARRKGIDVTIRTNCKVIDASSGPVGMTLSVRPKRGTPFEQAFTHVVLATGHQWPAEPEVRPGYFLSPWPPPPLPASRPSKSASGDHRSALSTLRWLWRRCMGNSSRRRMICCPTSHCRGRTPSRSP